MTFKKLGKIILNPADETFDKMMEAITCPRNLNEAVPTVDVRDKQPEEGMNGDRRFNLPFYWVKVKSK